MQLKLNSKTMYKLNIILSGLPFHHHYCQGICEKLEALKAMIADKKQKIKELNMQQHFPLQLGVAVGWRNICMSKCHLKIQHMRYSNYVNNTSDFFLV